MTSLSEKTYKLLNKVPKGKVTTYKELANALNTKAYRAIGQIMKNNPNAPETPCHRCVSSNGTIGGFRGQKKGKEIRTKINMLKSEGIRFKGNKIINFKEKLFSL